MCFSFSYIKLMYIQYTLQFLPLNGDLKDRLLMSIQLIWHELDLPVISPTISPVAVKAASASAPGNVAPVQLLHFLKAVTLGLFTSHAFNPRVAFTEEEFACFQPLHTLIVHAAGASTSQGRGLAERELSGPLAGQEVSLGGQGEEAFVAGEVCTDHRPLAFRYVSFEGVQRPAFALSTVL